jgi:cytochrome c-type biogenesis protein CcmH
MIEHPLVSGIASEDMASSPGQEGVWLSLADRFMRTGNNLAAATALRHAVEIEPENSAAWLSLANVLVLHANGRLTPAAAYAYREAAIADPRAPEPPFFLGLAYVQNGDIDKAIILWRALLQRAPMDAPWRMPLSRKLEELDGKAPK